MVRRKKGDNNSSNFFLYFIFFHFKTFSFRFVNSWPLRVHRLTVLFVLLNNTSNNIFEEAEHNTDTQYFACFLSFQSLKSYEGT